MTRADKLDPAMVAALDTAQPEELRAYFEERAAEYARASWARSTLKVYASQFKMFATWCQRCGYKPLPATPQAVAAFIAYEAERLTQDGEQRRVAGIRQALSAIRFTHFINGFPSPIDHPIVQQVWRGRGRIIGSLPIDKAEAMTVNDLLTMLSAMDHDDGSSVRDRALMVLGFACALRLGELQDLLWSDVTLQEEGVYIVVRDPKGKPGQEDGVMAPCAQKHELLCPVAAMRAWRALLLACGFADWDGYVFQRIGRDGAIKGRLWDRSVGEILQGRAAAAGIATHYTSHSLRNGWATWAAEKGRSLFLIQRHMRHMHASTTSRYIQTKDWLNHPGVGLY